MCIRLTISKDAVDVYEVYMEDLFWWIATSGKVARHFGLVQKPRPQRRPRRLGLEDCMRSRLHTHCPAATPHISNMGALLSLPLLAIPSVGTVSEYSRDRIHPPATRPPY